MKVLFLFIGFVFVLISLVNSVCAIIDDSSKTVAVVLLIIGVSFIKISRDSKSS